MGRVGPNSYTWFPDVDGPVKAVTKPVEVLGRKAQHRDAGWKAGLTDDEICRRLNAKAQRNQSEITSHDLPETFVNDKRWYYRNVYLKSQHWAELRLRKLRASPVCEVPGCGSRHRVEPHHLRYKNLYDVELEDLQTLCRKHHVLEHERLDREKRFLAYKGFVGGVPQTPKGPP